MQYQIYNTKTKDIIAWIESNAPINDFIIKDGFDVKSGNNLTALGIKNTRVKIIKEEN